LAFAEQKERIGKLQKLPVYEVVPSELAKQINSFLAEYNDNWWELSYTLKGLWKDLGLTLKDKDKDGYRYSASRQHRATSMYLARSPRRLITIYRR